MRKLSPIEVAHKFIEKHFPTCQGALLAGSASRGEATKTSDLDIIVFDKSLPSAYRESLIDFDWPIELFVHNLTSYKVFFEDDCKRARPSLPRMVAEGIILKDEEILDAIKSEAIHLLESGPEAWSEETITIKRYFITDVLDDFIGSSNRAEDLLIANTLAELVSEFVLRTNKQWIGASKWVIRFLRQYDEAFTERFVEAFDLFYRTGEKQEVIQLVHTVLTPYGGPLFNGFSIGKET
jgi:predicted nucleotidyltransferase